MARGKLHDLFSPKQQVPCKLSSRGASKLKHVCMFNLGKSKKLFLGLCRLLSMCKLVFRKLKLAEWGYLGPYQNYIFKDLLKRYFIYSMPLTKKLVSSIKRALAGLFRKKSRLNKKKLNKLNKKIFTKGKETKRNLKRRLY